MGGELANVFKVRQCKVKRRDAKIHCGSDLQLATWSRKRLSNSSISEKKKAKRSSPTTPKRCPPSAWATPENSTLGPFSATVTRTESPTISRSKKPTPSEQ